MFTSMQAGLHCSDSSAQVIDMQYHRLSQPELAAFSCNNEHLQALELEAKLMVSVAAMRSGTLPQKEENQTSCFPFLPAGATLTQASTLLESIVAENRAKEAQSCAIGVQLNFIDFCDTWELNQLERKIVLLLLMQLSSPSFFSTFQSSKLERNCDNGMEIGVLLSITSENLAEQLENRRHFDIHAPLLGKELLTANHQYMDSTTSVLRMSVYLDERYARQIIEDNNQYHIAFRFISQERSNVSLSQVILPDGIKQAVTGHAERYLASRRNGTLAEIDNFFGYGTGLTFLFYGPSNTGKTMLAKGLANHLECPLLSIKFEDMGKTPISNDEILAMLFREATLLDGIVFLDECDDVFGREETRLSRALLLEIEKSRCITILATNKPLELDPAMERRLSMKVKFDLPDAEQRLSMWQALLPPTVPLASDVDLKGLADRFFFSGGLIKNSILMALTSGIQPGADGGVLTQSALEQAATLQTTTISDLSRLREKVPQVSSLDDLPLGSRQRDQVRGLAKAWEWLRREEMGFNLLFNCKDVDTGIEAACGLAAEIGMTVNAYDITRISSLAENDKILDMVTQKRIFPMNAVFDQLQEGRAMTLLIDYYGEISGIIKSGYEKSVNVFHFELFYNLRHNDGLFCLVTKGLQDDSIIPVEFHQMITLTHTAEDLQIECWKDCLGEGTLDDEQLIFLASQHPMYLSEIELIARQARVRAIMDGRQHPCLRDVTAIIANYRGNRKASLLFGGET